MSPMTRLLSGALVASALGASATARALEVPLDELGERCAQLRTAAIADTTIAQTQVVAAAGTLPAYCRVDGYVTTPGDAHVVDNQVNFRVGLPGHWNDDFYFEGVGGWAGQIGSLNAGLARLRVGIDRHRPSKRRCRCELGPQQSAEADRLWLPRRSRLDRRGEGDRRAVLRDRSSLLDSRGLLERRADGIDGDSALSRRLRRSRRGSTRCKHPRRCSRNGSGARSCSCGTAPLAGSLRRMSRWWQRRR